jgi:mono/diheme cytochrome c family protein
MIRRIVASVFVFCLFLSSMGSFAFAQDGGETSAKDLWGEDCASCHGADGKAQTKMGKRFGAKDLTSAEVRAGLDRAEMIAVIRDGATDKDGNETMMGFADDLSDAQINSLVDYIMNDLGQ